MYIQHVFFCHINHAHMLIYLVSSVCVNSSESRPDEQCVWTVDWWILYYYENLNILSENLIFDYDFFFFLQKKIE